MERELLEKAKAYMARGNYYLEDGRFEMAYSAYMDALYTVGALLVYRDTGILLPAGELQNVLASRHPRVYDMLRRYGGMTDYSRETISALEKEVMEVLKAIELGLGEESSP